MASRMLAQFVKTPGEEACLPCLSSVISGGSRYLDQRPALRASLGVLMTHWIDGPPKKRPLPETDGVPETTSLAVPPGVNPVRAAGLRAFERDRLNLLAHGHAERTWVAYHGERLLGLARSRSELYELCDHEGIDEAEVFFHTLLPIVRHAYAFSSASRSFAR